MDADILTHLSGGGLLVVLVTREILRVLADRRATAANPLVATSLEWQAEMERIVQKNMAPVLIEIGKIQESQCKMTERLAVYTALQAGRRMAADET